MAYKLWMQIEKIDDDDDGEDCGLPDVLGRWDTLEEAQYQAWLILSLLNPEELETSDLPNPLASIPQL